MPANHYAIRCDRLRAALREQKLDAALVTSPVNVRYLTGFTGSNSLLIVTAQTSILFTDPRYAIQVEKEATAKTKQVVRGPLIDKAAAWLGAKRLRWLGVEAGHLTFANLTTLDEKLPKRCKVGPLDEALEGSLSLQRFVKSADEIAKVRHAVNVNSHAFEQSLTRFKAGMTEAKFAAEIDYAMRRLGAEKTAFDTIVASGAHSALPHAHPRNVKIGAVAIVLVDMGAQVEGYMSDMTRMVHVGKPSPKFLKLHQAVLEAQLAAVAAIRPGAKVKDVDGAARRVLKKAGFEKQFVHSTGHGLGLEIHEGPRIGKGVETELREGMVVTAEPGAYIEGFGGVRIEDTVLVTKAGCEILTPTPKELRVIA